MRRRAVVALAAAVALASTLPAASAKRLPGFRSPSGNISCLFLPADRDVAGHRLPSQLLCSIRRAAYAARLQDRCLSPRGRRGEGVDWHGWRLTTRGKPSLLCSGGILYNVDRDEPSYVTLRYGRRWRHGAFTCRARISGVTCRNRGGHGLLVSRESWRAW